MSISNKQFRYFSTFSGIGGFELGITRAYEDFYNRHQATRAAEILRGDMSDTASELMEGTASCVGYSEIDKYAVQIYQKHFDHTNYGDITKIDETELPDFDMLVGGFPCQSFSIAGKRGGFGDTRGTMFFELARILRYKKPRLFLFENVKGLLSHDEGRTFNTIIATLDELGYDLQWQVLNSKNHGVPQNRERVLIVGHLRGTARPEIFPFGSVNQICDGKDGGKKSSDESTIGPLRSQGDKAMVRVNSSQDGKLSPKDGVSFTLSAGHYNQPKISIDMKIRRLTPIECERLQGFPDNWTAEGWDGRAQHIEGFLRVPTLIKISDTQRYKTLGNAVTTNVIQAIMERIFASL